MCVPFCADDFLSVLLGLVTGASSASSIESSRSGPAAGRGSGRIARLGSASSHSAMRCAAHPTHGRLPSTMQALGVLAELGLLLCVTVQVAAFDVAVSIKLAFISLTLFFAFL